MHASLFSNEHINFASSSSRSLCLCSAAAKSGSSAAALAVLGSSETRSSLGEVIGPGDGDGTFECASDDDDGPFNDGVTLSTLTLADPLTFGVDGSAFPFELGEGDGEGVGITAGVFFFKKLWSTVNWIA